MDGDEDDDDDDDPQKCPDRSLAIALCLCGAGFGTFTLSPLETYITANHGWRWAVSWPLSNTLACQFWHYLTIFLLSFTNLFLLFHNFSQLFHFSFTCLMTTS